MLGFCGELIYPEPESTSSALSLICKSWIYFFVDPIHLFLRLEWFRCYCLGNIQIVVQALWFTLGRTFPWNCFTHRPRTSYYDWRKIGKTRSWKWSRSNPCQLNTGHALRVSRTLDGSWDKRFQLISIVLALRRGLNIQ